MTYAKNFHSVLGVPNGSSPEAVTKAYRKLAMQYHPDRDTGNEAKFKEIKEAYETIEKNSFLAYVPPKSQQQYRQTWEAPKSPGNTWRDTDDINNIFEEMKKKSEQYEKARAYSDPFKPKTKPASNELVATVSLLEAYRGFTLEVEKPSNLGQAWDLKPSFVKIPGGVADGYRGAYTTNENGVVYVTLRIRSSDFRVKGFTSDDLFGSGLNIGDVELDVPIEALDIISGAWINVRDLTGEQLQVRVPEGFNPTQRLKVAGKGYWGWSSERGTSTGRRMDMYLKLVPQFNKDVAKITALYQSIQDAGPRSS